MPGNRTYTISAMMLLYFIVALALRPGPIFTLLVIQVIGVFLCTHLLIKNLPGALRRLMTSNCRRADGTWSSRRAKIEADALRKVRRDTVFAFALLLLPTNAVLWYVNSEVVPFSIGVDAVGSFKPDVDEWKENLRDEEQELERWGERNRLSVAAVQQRKKLLWQWWPAVVVGLVSWLAICFFAFSAAYTHSLTDLAASMEYRAEKYRLLDLHASVEGTKAKRKRGRKHVSTNQ